MGSDRVAWLNLRLTVPERVAAFAEGLRRHGFRIEVGLPTVERDGDVLVTWNRIGPADAIARRFEARGLPVLVAENAAWGNDFAGGHWYSIARGRHNTAGMFPEGGPERWDRLGVGLHAKRERGETVILPQRGIGSPPTAMPRDWPARAHAAHGGRIRPHPGRGASMPLWDDLLHAATVVTWGSGAAILASLWGCTVYADMPQWIGAHGDRLAMFRRLAWAQWRLDEITAGEPFARLLAKG